ncbi:transcriptional regulator, TetR family protein [Pseudooceanicola batsensis HTCC2597]|uniref:Transcriptional regulator, TetR family protein n=1 Tax=Pseudooceanicola batsensis (strain ATCC BAA-863 / DSM 15984 / KCTC 12145 / HTCC2597) TaxID=252305 RepID=A3U198_PSEBH|nr:TetR/AcrR family transcriptional regulator [Pseudooceanicola batsensis]EAQ02081.1 transcriptional regulator, TetR family protein [Pseudooceanicola batsensis HTCC2597]
MSRREKTEQAILEALEAQLIEGGMQSVGVNAIAKRAGVSKELIYRYFDGLPGLMSAWMQGRDYWSSKAGVLRADDTSNLTPAALIRGMLREQETVLARDQAVAAVRRWELIERTEVGDRLRARREREARTFINRLDGLTDAADVPAFVGVLLAGILYLSLRAKTEDVFLGVPLRTEEGWGRIWNAVDLMISALPEDLREESLRTLEEARASNNLEKDE